MNPIKRWRDWRPAKTSEDDAPLPGSVPAWVLSLLVHLGLLIALTAVAASMPRREQPVAINTVESAKDEPLDATPRDFYFSNTAEEKIGAKSSLAAGAAFAQAPTVAPVSVPTRPQLAPVAGPTPDIRLQEQVAAASGPHFSDNLSVHGAAGVGATGAEGAIDRITHEILLSLEEHKTLVVWLFDQSGSLEPQRAVIRERFDRIYRELGVIEASGNPAFKRHDSRPLLSAVLAFGEKITFLTPKPTDNVDEIKTVLAGMKTDESGVEMTFTAVRRAVERYAPYRTRERRNIMFVVFTDEVGDDEREVDSTILACRKYEIPVYVVGVPAPFGRRKAFLKYMPPQQYLQEPMWVPVDQGPESYQPEMVQLGFSGRREVDETMDSGFGPYALTRLTYETGGIFFAVHPNREARHAVSRNETAVLASQMSHFFDPEIMRSYRPDYVSIQQYEKLLTQNKARLALVEAARMSWIAPIDRPPMEFPKLNDGDLANKLSLAQRAAAVLEPKINMLYEILRKGEKDRPKLTQPRWQAGYDLSLGRVLAVKVRTEAYNSMLAKAKQGMKFADPHDDTWVLVPDDTVSVSSVLEKQAAQAKELLEQVAREHKNTPWGVLAERELGEKMGWKWTERYTGVKEPKKGSAGGGASQPRDDAARKLQKPRMTIMPKL